MIIKREKKIKLDPYERTIEEFTYMDVDLTVVEILPEDEILNEFFLRPSIYYMYNFEKLDFEKITIIHYPNGILNYSYGKIENIDHYTFSHSASIDIGSSGGPIFLKNTIKVIGIHKSTNEDIPINYGNFIGPIYKYFRNLPKHKDRFNNKKLTSVDISKDKAFPKINSYYDHYKKNRIDNLTRKYNETKKVFNDQERLGQTNNYGPKLNYDYNKNDSRLKQNYGYRNLNNRYGQHFFNGKKERVGDYPYGDEDLIKIKFDIKIHRRRSCNKDNIFNYDRGFINNAEKISEYKLPRLSSTLDKPFSKRLNK